MSAASGVPALLEESRTLEYAGDYAAALQRAQQAWEAASASADLEEQAASLARMSWLHYRLGHYEVTDDLARRALERAGPESPARADAWIALGVCAMETGILEQVESYFLQAADLCREIGYTVSRQRALHNLAAGVYTLRGQFDLALSTYEEAYRLACELDSPNQYNCLIAMSYMLQQTGQFSRARQVLQRVSQIDAIPVLYRGYIFMSYGMVELGEGDLRQAARWFRQSRAIAEEIGDPALNIFLRIGESQLRRQSGEAAAACEWANDAVAWASRASNQRILGRALIERGQAHWLNQQLASAEADFHLAIENLRQRQQFYDLARAYFYLAALSHARGFPGADTTWEQAAGQIIDRGYGAILDQNRNLAYPLIITYMTADDPHLAELSSRCMQLLQKVPPPPLRVITLGGLEVWQGACQIDPNLLRKRRAGELLVLLILAPGYSLLVDQIVEALWPDKDFSASQMLFHQSTSTLRRALEPGLPGKFPSRYLTVEDGVARLHLPSDSSLDFQIFEGYYRQGAWQAAIDAYCGDFLPEQLYTEWTAAPRQRLAQLYERALLKRASQLFAGSEYEPALESCRRLLEREPWHEQATLLGMRACLELHDRSAALQLYRNLERALQTEFGLQPPAEIQHLYRQITAS